MKYEQAVGLVFGSEANIRMIDGNFHALTGVVGGPWSISPLGTELYRKKGSVRPHFTPRKKVIFQVFFSASMYRVRRDGEEFLEPTKKFMSNKSRLRTFSSTLNHKSLSHDSMTLPKQQQQTFFPSLRGFCNDHKAINRNHLLSRTHLEGLQLPQLLEGFSFYCFTIATFI